MINSNCFGARKCINSHNWHTPIKSCAERVTFIFYSLILQEPLKHYVISVYNCWRYFVIRVSHVWFYVVFIFVRALHLLHFVLFGFSTLISSRKQTRLQKILRPYIFHILAGNPTTHRLEQNWHYTYAVGFRSSGCQLRMVCEKPKHVRIYIALIWFLIFWWL